MDCCNSVKHIIAIIIYNDSYSLQKLQRLKILINHLTYKLQLCMRSKIIFLFAKSIQKILSPKHLQITSNDIYEITWTIQKHCRTRLHNRLIEDIFRCNKWKRTIWHIGILWINLLTKFLRNIFLFCNTFNYFQFSISVLHAIFNFTLSQWQSGKCN